ncbi:hatching enzyme 1.2-like [Periophthalmus magnuspinnatus]|uniref:hatching enzyme 1.2-like n=1 Tax=Periophthalmus magnuspinnatus TaxID=409849 RepID=UPI00145B66CE|nr:hatching enzyme 1.2-like [Periophthalmus magnuspinnatus]
MSITKVFRYFSEESCIRFIPRTNQRDHLYIHSSNGCWSFIGRTGGAQKLSLQSTGCIIKGIIQHELLHALGFNHEHIRSDRDQFVRVEWKNIIKGKEHNFQKLKTLNQRTPYDYGSVMHYKNAAFSKNGLATLVACNGYSKFGLAKKMSQWDKYRINKLYCK